MKTFTSARSATLLGATLSLCVIACGGDGVPGSATLIEPLRQDPARQATRAVGRGDLSSSGDAARPLSSPADVAAIAASIAKAPTPDAALALVPALALSDHPDLADFIRGTATPASKLPPGPVFHSGALIPAVPVAGRLLLGGLLPPYGRYAPDPVNNWALPNAADDGCTDVPDTGPFFDFRNACRQHDLGYLFAPDTRRGIDNQFLDDMYGDCAGRDTAARPLCYAVAGTYYAGVRTFGSAYYGGSSFPGYNAPGSPALPPAPACAQPTHAWVDTGGLGLTLPHGASIYLTGVVRKHSRILFQFRSRAGSLVAEHLSYFADDSCVVHHTAERFDTAHLPAGVITVTATYPRWEDNRTETATVANLQILP